MAQDTYPNRPTFLVLGAYKAGTTSIHRYLKQHPQVFMSRIKEIRFLTYAGHLISPLSPPALGSIPWRVQSLAAYEDLFAAAGDFPARGDVSPCYLAFPEQSVLGIQTYIPAAKLIAILRQPVDRTYSSYLGLVKIGLEEEMDFRKMLHYEAEGKLRKLDGRQRRDFAEGFYFKALNHYFQHFPREQIRIYLYDDFKQDGTAMMQDIFRFIGVDDNFVPDMSIRHNAAAWPRVKFAPTFTRWAEHIIFRTMIKRLPKPFHTYYWRTLQTSPPPLDPDLRRELLDLYREDILQTQMLINRDLSHWLV